jgi:hypothetical protein
VVRRVARVVRVVELSGVNDEVLDPERRDELARQLQLRRQVGLVVGRDGQPLCFGSARAATARASEESTPPENATSALPYVARISSSSVSLF